MALKSGTYRVGTQIFRINRSKMSSSALRRVEAQYRAAQSAVRSQARALESARQKQAKIERDKRSAAEDRALERRTRLGKTPVSRGTPTAPRQTGGGVSSTFEAAVRSSRKSVSERAMDRFDRKRTRERNTAQRKEIRKLERAAAEKYPSFTGDRPSDIYKRGKYTLEASEGGALSKLVAGAYGLEGQRLLAPKKYKFKESTELRKKTLKSGKVVYERIKSAPLGEAVNLGPLQPGKTYREAVSTGGGGGGIRDLNRVFNVGYGGAMGGSLTPEAARELGARRIFQRTARIPRETGLIPTPQKDQYTTQATYTVEDNKTGKIKEFKTKKAADKFSFNQYARENRQNTADYNRQLRTAGVTLGEIQKYERKQKDDLALNPFKSITDLTPKPRKTIKQVKTSKKEIIETSYRQTKTQAPIEGLPQNFNYELASWASIGGISKATSGATLLGKTAAVGKGIVSGVGGYIGYTVSKKIVEPVAKGYYQKTRGIIKYAPESFMGIPVKEPLQAQFNFPIAGPAAIPIYYGAKYAKRKILEQKGFSDATITEYEKRFRKQSFQKGGAYETAGVAIATESTSLYLGGALYSGIDKALTPKPSNIATYLQPPVKGFKSPLSFTGEKTLLKPFGKFKGLQNPLKKLTLQKPLSIKSYTGGLNILTPKTPKKAKIKAQPKINKKKFKDIIDTKRLEKDLNKKIAYDRGTGMNLGRSDTGSEYIVVDQKVDKIRVFSDTFKGPKTKYGSRLKPPPRTPNMKVEVFPDKTTRFIQDYNIVKPPKVDRYSSAFRNFPRGEVEIVRKRPLTQLIDGSWSNKVFGKGGRKRTSEYVTNEFYSNFNKPGQKINLNKLPNTLGDPSGIGAFDTKKIVIKDVYGRRRGDTFKNIFEQRKNIDYLEQTFQAEAKKSAKKRGLKGVWDNINKKYGRLGRKGTSNLITISKPPSPDKALKAALKASGSAAGVITPSFNAFAAAVPRASVRSAFPLIIGELIAQRLPPTRTIYTQTRTQRRIKSDISSKKLNIPSLKQLQIPGIRQTPKIKQSQIPKLRQTPRQKVSQKLSYKFPTTEVGLTTASILKTRQKPTQKQSTRSIFNFYTPQKSKKMSSTTLDMNLDSYVFSDTSYTSNRKKYQRAYVAKGRTVLDKFL